MLRLSRDQSNNIGKFFFQLGTRRTTQKHTVHDRKTKPDIKHIFTRLTKKKSFISSSCTIIADINCIFWQVSILENTFSGKCPFGQMDILASVHTGK